MAPLELLTVRSGRVRLFRAAVNIITSQAALDKFVSYINTQTYSMNSSAKSQKISVPLKSCKIDFAKAAVVRGNCCVAESRPCVRCDY